MPQPLPSFGLLRDHLIFQASSTPNAEAAVLGDRAYSYAELLRAVDDLAKAFIAAGILPGDRVATLQSPHPDFLTSFLAATAIGAIWVGLNPRHRIQELTHVMTDSAPAILLTRSRIGDRDYAGDIAALSTICPSLTQIVLFDGEPPIDGATNYAAFVAAGQAISDDALSARHTANDPAAPCLIVYTSGSTGKPKGALLSQRAIIAFSIEQNRIWPVMPIRVLNFLPINHIGCVVDMSVPCLIAGGTLIFMEHFDAGESVAMVERQRLTAMMSVPSVFALQMAEPGFATTDHGSIQLAIWEGAAIPAPILDTLLDIAPLAATNYGLTEALAVTVTEPTRDRDVLLNSVGFPFPNAEIRLVDDQGQDAGDGDAGEIWVRSPYLFLGYWRQPEATRAAFTEDGFFRTGDLAERRPDGRLRIVGRLKEMYKSGGYNVYPREIEAAIEAHPAVAIAAVVPVPDPLWQEVGIAYVVLKAPAAEADILAWCRERLANYKIPKACIIAETLPLLPIGKVDRVALRAHAAGRSGEAGR